MGADSRETTHQKIYPGSSRIETWSSDSEFPCFDRFLFPFPLLFELCRVGISVAGRLFPKCLFLQRFINLFFRRFEIPLTTAEPGRSGETETQVCPMSRQPGRPSNVSAIVNVRLSKVWKGKSFDFGLHHREM